jgi:hypothetical protein
MLKKIITISNISPIKSKADGKVIGYNIFEDEKTKYSMFLESGVYNEAKEKIGVKKSTAFEEFEAQRMMTGSQVGIAYNEKPNDYEIEVKGVKKTIHGVNRTIAWFSTPLNIQEFANAMRTQPQPQEELPIIQQESDLIDDYEPESKIKIEDIPF